MYLETWRRIESAFMAWNARWGRLAGNLLRWIVPVGLLVWLAWYLTGLGWAKLWYGRPRGLGFYAVVLLQYYIQPIADLIIYRYLLGVGRALPLTPLMRKRFVNNFLDYSGEVYFFFWARKHLTLPNGRLMHAVKDTNVLSASAALVMVWLTLLAVLLSGGVRLPAMLQNGLWGTLALASLPLALALALVAGGRKVTTLSRTEIFTTFGIHFVRSVVKLAMEFMFWWLSGALPSMVACLQFVALRVVVTRLPLVPNKDLVFVGVGIAVAGMMAVSAPKVAAALVLITAIGRLQDLVNVGLPWLFEQFQIRRRVPAD
jgi:hypothetical protein